MFSILTPIIQRIQPTALHRIKANLTLNGKIQSIDEKKIYHVDSDYCLEHPGVMTTGIYYVNTNNGFTLFENGEKVKSVANRLMIFDGLEKHCSVVQTDETARYIININLLL